MKIKDIKQIAKNFVNNRTVGGKTTEAGRLATDAALTIFTKGSRVDQKLLSRFMNQGSATPKE